MTITTREQAIEDLGMFGIEKPQIYMLHIIPLVEMIWAGGVVQECELGILNDSLRKAGAAFVALAAFGLLAYGARPQATKQEAGS